MLAVCDGCESSCHASFNSALNEPEHAGQYVPICAHAQTFMRRQRHRHLWFRIVVGHVTIESGAGTQANAHVKSCEAAKTPRGATA